MEFIVLYFFGTAIFGSLILEGDEIDILLKTMLMEVPASS